MGDSQSTEAGGGKNRGGGKQPSMDDEEYARKYIEFTEDTVTTLEIMLNTKLGHQHFLKFQEATFAAENINFWTAAVNMEVEYFGGNSRGAEIAKKPGVFNSAVEQLASICETYTEEDAPMLINLSGKLHADVRKKHKEMIDWHKESQENSVEFMQMRARVKMMSTMRSLFEQAAKEVHSMMKGQFLQFKKSAGFQEFLDEARKMKDLELRHTVKVSDDKRSRSRGSTTSSNEPEWVTKQRNRSKSVGRSPSPNPSSSRPKASLSVAKPGKISVHQRTRSTPPSTGPSPLRHTLPNDFTLASCDDSAALSSLPDSDNAKKASTLTRPSTPSSSKSSFLRKRFPKFIKKASTMT